MKCVRYCLFTFGANLLIILSLYLFLPNYRETIFSEDRLIENITAVLYLFVSILCTIFAIKSRRYKVALSVVGVISFICFFEEISYLERILKLNMPRFYGIKIDGFHDLFYFAYKAAIHFKVSQPSLLYLFSGLGAVAVIFLFSKLIPKARNALLTMHPEFSILFSFFLTCITLSLLIDLDIILNDLLFALEEMIELNAAVALMFCGISLYRQKAGKQRRSGIVKTRGVSEKKSIIPEIQQ
jgi:hypothetical protein